MLQICPRMLAIYLPLHSSSSSSCQAHDKFRLLPFSFSFSFELRCVSLFHSLFDCPDPEVARWRARRDNRCRNLVKKVVVNSLRDDWVDAHVLVENGLVADHVLDARQLGDLLFVRRLGSLDLVGDLLRGGRTLDVVFLLLALVLPERLHFFFDDTLIGLLLHVLPVLGHLVGLDASSDVFLVLCAFDGSFPEGFLGRGTGLLHFACKALLMLFMALSTIGGLFHELGDALRNDSGHLRCLTSGLASEDLGAASDQVRSSFEWNLGFPFAKGRQSRPAGTAGVLGLADLEVQVVLDDCPPACFQGLPLSCQRIGGFFVGLEKVVILKK